jgi:hypothetical protein
MVTCDQCFDTKVRVTFNGTIDCPNRKELGKIPGGDAQ